MRQRSSIADATNPVPALLHDVERGEHSAGDEGALPQPKPDLWASYLRWRAESEGVLTDADIDQLADPTRHQESSRHTPEG